MNSSRLPVSPSLRTPAWAQTSTGESMSRDMRRWFDSLANFTSRAANREERKGRKKGSRCSRLRNPMHRSYDADANAEALMKRSRSFSMLLVLLLSVPAVHAQIEAITIPAGTPEDLSLIHI